MQLLVSVRNLAEARLAAAAGVDFIDLKDPAAGALGALPPADIAEIVRVLRGLGGAQRSISATTGDLPSEDIGAILARVLAVAATGVDLVKVGIDGGPASALLLAALSGCQASVVPVLMADHGVDLGLVQTALGLNCFPAVMLDTADKGVGSLLQRRPEAELAGFIATVQGGGSPAQGWGAASRRPATLAGLAGALRAEELPMLRQLAPDFAGFRSAVCNQGRANALDPQRLAALCHPAPHAAIGASAQPV